MSTQITKDITNELINYLEKSNLIIGEMDCYIEKFNPNNKLLKRTKFITEKTFLKSKKISVYKESTDIYIHCNLNENNRKRTDILLVADNFCKCNFEIKTSKYDLLESLNGKNFTNQFNFLVTTPDLFYYADDMIQQQYEGVGLMIRESKNNFIIKDYARELSYDKNYKNAILTSKYLWYEL